jgi:hypothetical protein
LAALFALGVLALLPGGPARPDVVSADHDEQLTIQVDTNPETNGGETFEFAVTDACTGTPALEDDGSTGIDCAEGQTRIVVTPHAGFTLTAQSCTFTAGTTAGTDSVTSDTNIDDNDLRVTLADNEHATCAFTFDPSVAATTTATVTSTPGTPTPTVTTTAGPAASLTVSAAPSTVNCGGSSFVTVVVKNAQGGNVADGTSVTVSTGGTGTVSPATATTSGGGILTIFTAPATGGTANITATSGSATGSSSLTITCGPAATATTAAPPPLPTASTGGGGGIISPPNTGDAGIIETDSGFAWQTFVGILLIVGSMVGGLTLVRRRA